MQLNLFTMHRCSYCQRSSISIRNPHLWDGFRDLDTGHLVCSWCRIRHYSEKQEGPHRGLYSEMPVPLA